MLIGIKKNLNDNYSQLINLKRKDQLKSKEDVPVFEAFELYMLKNFHKEIFLEMGLNDTSAYPGMVIFVILTYGTHNYPFLVGGWNLSSGLIRV